MFIFAAVILPDTLAPLPVTSRGDGETGEDDFVLPGDVRRVLLGEVSVAPVAGRAGECSKAFASGLGFGVVRQMPRAEEGAVRPTCEGNEMHSTLEAPPASRPVPSLRVAVDGEENLGRPGFGDRWWKFGMGLAAAVMLSSGLVVDFVSREAARRGQLAMPRSSEVQAPVTPLDEPAFDKEPKVSGSLASTSPVSEED